MHESCTQDGSGGSATCSCQSSACDSTNPVCDATGSLVTCAVDSSGCYYEASVTPCEPPDVCFYTQCYVGALFDAVCAPECNDGCSAGQTECVPDGLVPCTLGSNGCWSFGAATACPTNQGCTGAAGAAACDCLPTVCGEDGPTCDPVGNLVTCATDSNGCMFEASTSTCASPDVCTGPAGAASCAAACVDSCGAGETECTAEGIATCELAASGCWEYGAAVACPTNQQCSGNAGAAECVCTPTVCPENGTVCGREGKVVTCQTDSNGCLFVASTAACSPYPGGETCVGEAPDAGCGCPGGSVCTMCGP